MTTFDTPRLAKAAANEQMAEKRRSCRPTSTRDNDVDCDAFVDRDNAAADCEPLRYCDGMGAAGCIGASA